MLVPACLPAYLDKGELALNGCRCSQSRLAAAAGPLQEHTHKWRLFTVVDLQVKGTDHSVCIQEIGLCACTEGKIGLQVTSSKIRSAGG